MIHVKGRCESQVHNGPRVGQPCPHRARWSIDLPTMLGGNDALRLCGAHRKGYTHARLLTDADVHR